MRNRFECSKTINPFFTSPNYVLTLNVIALLYILEIYLVTQWRSVGQSAEGEKHFWGAQISVLKFGEQGSSKGKEWGKGHHLIYATPLC